MKDKTDKLNPKVILVKNKLLTCKVCNKTFTNVDLAVDHIHNQNEKDSRIARFNRDIQLIKWEKEFEETCKKVDAKILRESKKKKTKKQIQALIKKENKQKNSRG